MRKAIRFLLGVIACAAIVYGCASLAGYIRESSKSVSLKESLINSAVEVKETATSAANDDKDDKEKDSEKKKSGETAPIEVDFKVLSKTNDDVIGWLYSEDTPINLPVVQSDDNSYYLRRMIDGSGNSSGTLFADCRNAPDFSDNNTIIYGHNMKNGEMFGSLSEYKKQSYYDEHPVMWLLTPDGDYKIEVVAGYVTTVGTEIYTFDQSDDTVLDIVNRAVEQSTFKTDLTLKKGDRYITLSTCSYEYDDARYVLIGRLNELK